MACDRGCVVYNMIFLALFTHHTDKKAVILRAFFSFLYNSFFLKAKIYI